MVTSPLDITYCMNQGCPFKECERHPRTLKEVRRLHPGAMVSVTDFSGTCRDYIGWLAEKASSGRKGGKHG